MKFKPILILAVFSLVLLFGMATPVSASSFDDFLDNLGLGSLSDYTVVYKQEWGSICCVQEYDWDKYTRYTDDTSFVKCDKYTNECVFDLHPDETFWNGYAIKYSICDQNGDYCKSPVLLEWGAFSSSSPSEIRSFTIQNGESVKFFSGGWDSLGDDRDHIIFTQKWKNFYIKGQENGKVYRQESCVLNSDLKKRVLSDGLNELTMSGSNSCQNYLIDFTKVATQTYSYSGQEVICQSRSLYSIDEMVFKDGTVNKMQGSKIKTVECCPSEANCDESKFKFVEENERECWFDSECSNGGDAVAVTGTSVKSSSCINGECVMGEEKRVECTNNAICISKSGSKSVCNLNSFECEESSNPIGVCGDGVCESIIGESTQTCPQDCGEINHDDSWPWWYYALGIFVLIIAFKPIQNIVKTVYSFLKGLPLIGRLFP